MQKTYLKAFYFFSVLIGMLLVVFILIFGERNFIDYIISIASILVTAFLGIATYGQTKEQILQDRLDKIPFFVITNFMNFSDIDVNQFHIGSGQYSFVPRLRYLKCVASNTKLNFTISLKDITKSHISKANVYYSVKEISSYKDLKKLPPSEKLNLIISNANKQIAFLEENGMPCNEQLLIARDESTRILKELEESQTPDMYNCNSDDIYDIELITCMETQEDVQKYLNEYCPTPFFIVIDMETIQGYRYTQIISFIPRYANIYSDGEEMELIFSVQDFDSKILTIPLEKINWKRDFDHSCMKEIAKKIK